MAVAPAVPYGFLALKSITMDSFLRAVVPQFVATTKVDLKVRLGVATAVAVA